MKKYCQIRNLPQSPYFEIIDIMYLDRESKDLAFKLNLIEPYNRLFTSQIFAHELILITNFNPFLIN